MQINKLRFCTYASLSLAIGDYKFANAGGLAMLYGIISDLLSLSFSAVKDAGHTHATSDLHMSLIRHIYMVYTLVK